MTLFALVLALSCVTQGVLVVDPDTGVEVDSGTDVDTDTHTDTDTDTDSGSLDDTADLFREAPEVYSVVLRELADDLIEVSVLMDDADSDLPGGELRVMRDGVEAFVFDIPADLASWNGTVATVTLPIVDSCRHGSSVSVTASVSDAADLASNEEVGVLQLSGRSVRVTENTATGYPWSEIGSIDDLPVWVCGDIDQTNPVLTPGFPWVPVLPADEDLLWFEIEQDGHRRFDLTWANPSADYDVFLVRTDGVTPIMVAAGNNHAGDQPDSTLTNLFAAATYRLAVTGWDGPAGAWTLKISRP